MPAVKIADNVYSVGAVDYDVREFHGYLTPFGATYNAYIVLDEKITLIDTVKEAFSAELVANIKEVCNIEDIEVIISNHAEPDHSGAMPTVYELCKKATVYATVAGEKSLKSYYGECPLPFVKVKSGDSICTGKYNFDFIATPMVHWPDNMVTYCRENKILFSNDAFGQHIATPERFVDEVGLKKTMSRVSDYYANIIMPLGSQVHNVLKSLEHCELDMIAPAHGLIWRSNINDVIEKYRSYANHETDDKKMVIAFDSMWGSTRLLAYELCEEYTKKGFEVSVFDLKVTHVSTVMAAVIDAKYIAVGSSTLNRGILPTVASFLTYCKGLAPKKRIGLAFGSYGWSGESVGDIQKVFEAMQWEQLDCIKRVYRD